MLVINIKAQRIHLLYLYLDFIKVHIWILSIVLMIYLGRKKKSACLTNNGDQSLEYGIVQPSQCPSQSVLHSILFLGLVLSLNIKHANWFLS